jgi:hypothetical protein
MNQKEPTCKCGEAKSKHNLLSLKPGALTGPYLRLDGTVFCQQYREAR